MPVENTSSAITREESRSISEGTLECERSRLDRRIELDLQVLQRANSELSAVLQLDENENSAISQERCFREIRLPETHAVPDRRISRKEQGNHILRHQAVDSAAEISANPLFAACRCVVEKLG